MCVQDKDFLLENKLFAGLTNRLNGFVDKLADLNKKPGRFSSGYFKELGKLLTGGVAKDHTVGVAYNVQDQAKLSYMEANVYRFSCAKSTSMVRDLNKLVRAQKKVGNFQEFRKGVDALKINYNKDWLETEYRMTQSVSRNSARHERFIRELDVYQYAKYKTIGDERVRDWHQVLHNKIVRIGSVEYDLIFPPNGWRCRCEFVQVDPSGNELRAGLATERDLVELLSNENVTSKQTAYEYMQKNGFDKNRAKSGVIFDENRMYIQSFNEAGVTYQDYDLDHYQQFKNANPRIANLGEETVNFKYDYRKKLIETNYRKYETDTLLRPFEVWSVYHEAKDLFEKKYIGYSEVITVQLTNQREQITKVETLDDAAINKLRRGALLYGNR